MAVNFEGKISLVEKLRREKISKWFRENHPKPWLGKKMSEEHRKKISETHKGKIPHIWTKEMKEKVSRALIGRKISASHKKNMSIARSDEKHHLWGKKHSEETKRKMSESHKGIFSKEKHPNWISDRTQIKQYWTERNNPEYKQWRQQVWLRDNFKCKIANQDCEGRIEAHHILNWSSHPTLRYEVNNGITLCHFHHPRKRFDEQKFLPLFQGLVKMKVN